MSGTCFVEALENGVSMWPKFDGRWPCVSGIKFKFDPKRPIGQRIFKDSITDDNDQILDLNKRYTVALKNFMLAGKDGYECLKSDEIQVLQKKEDCPTI